MNSTELRKALVEMKVIAQSKGKRYQERIIENKCNMPYCKCGGKCPEGVLRLLRSSRKHNVCQVLERACENLLKGDNFRLFVRNTETIPAEIVQDVYDLIFASCLIKGRQRRRPGDLPRFESTLVKMYGSAFLDAVRELETIRRAPCPEIVDARRFNNFEFLHGCPGEEKEKESHLRYLLENLKKAHFVFERADGRKRDDLLQKMCGYRHHKKFASAKTLAFQVMLCEEPLAIHLQTLNTEISSVMKAIETQIMSIERGAVERMDYGKHAVNIIMAARSCKFASLQFVLHLKEDKFGDFLKRKDENEFASNHYHYEGMVRLLSEENVKKYIDDTMKLPCIEWSPDDPDVYADTHLFNRDDVGKTMRLSEEDQQSMEDEKNAIAPYENYDKVSRQWVD